jgi:hypothetical protein
MEEAMTTLLLGISKPAGAPAGSTPLLQLQKRADHQDIGPRPEVIVTTTSDIYRG